MTLRQAADKAAQVLRGAGYTALFAGGCVRDMLLGQTPKDIDIATDAPPDRVQTLFRGSRAVGARFGVVMARIGGHDFEIATFRTESDYGDHRRPRKVVFATAEEDARRRDFTINGMFYDPLTGEVIDYVGGRSDLEARRVRAIGTPDERLDEDHLRMLRAVRFAARLEFEIEHETYTAILRHAGSIRTISPERIRMELEQILTHPTRRCGWELMHGCGLSAHLVDGVQWTDAEADAVASRLAQLPDRASFPLVMVTLLRKLDPGDVGKVCRRLRLSRAEIDAVVWLRRQLPQAMRASDLELADVKLLLANPGCPDLMDLLRAELIARSASLAPHRVLASRSSQIDPAEVAPPPLLTGDDLLAMKLPPGPRYAEILRIVYRAQLNEQLADRRAALSLARTLIGPNP